MNDKLEQVITEIDSAILELIVSESVKDMFLYEEEDLEPILADLEINKLSNLFFEKFIPYFELNLLYFCKDQALFEAFQPIENAKQNIKYYRDLLGKKLSNVNLIELVKSGTNKAARAVNKIIPTGVKRSIGTEVSKRLDYASQNLKSASDVVKQKIK